MQQPPQYIPSAPTPKKSNTGLIVGLIIGGVLLCCIAPVALLGGGGWWAFTKAKGMAECAIAMEDLRKSLTEYAADHNGRLPDAAKWQDEVKSYYAKIAQSKKQERGPLAALDPDGVWGCKNDNSTTGIAFNSSISGKSLDQIKDKVSTIVLFEVAKASRNNSMPYKRQDAANAPKMFGKPRGWIEVTLEGEPVVQGGKGNTAPLNLPD